MKLPRHLAQDILTLETQARQGSLAAQDALHKAAATQSQIDRTENTMGFFDKYLWGVFGDKQRIEKRDALDYAEQTLSEQGRQAEEKAAAALAQIDDMIHVYLQQHDPDYQRLITPYVAACDISAATNGFIDLVGKAIAEVDEAEDTETLDLISDNNGISLLSYLDNESAGDAISDVRQAAPQFQKAVADFNTNRHAFGVDQMNLSGIEDGLDTLLDVAFDGLDFMSFFTLASLSTAKKELCQAHNYIQPMQAEFNAIKEQSGQRLADYRQQVYSTLHSEPKRPPSDDQKFNLMN